MADLTKTIYDEDEVPDYSEDSDVEQEYQPKKHKEKNTVFDSAFTFVSNAKEYNKDTWDDMSKFIKRKVKNKVDDKIAESREHIKIIMPDSDEEDSDKNTTDIKSDDELSDSEMTHDKVKNKIKNESKRKKKKKEANVEETNEEEQCVLEGDDVEEFFEDAPPMDENSSFQQMNLSRPLMKAIAALNYVHPTPIQGATIPVALLGRDICGCAATGTGKTAAYMLPILERLLYKPKGHAAVTRVLVLVPTRELGVQVYQVTKQLTQFTSIAVGLSVGGLDLKLQEGVLRKSPDIIIATPGRLIDHLKNTPSFSVEDLEILVLDEADRMLDENFADQMKEIIKMCSRTRQTLLFSATMTEAVNDLASVCLNKPVKIFVNTNQDVAFNLRQEFVRLREGKESDRNAILAALVCRTFRDHTMIFVQTKRDAHRVLITLGLLGSKVVELHGNLSQPQRLESLRKFRDEEADILIATDVAARGLDIKGVKSVINYAMPPTIEHYIHRVGRTARAGRSGVSVSIVTENDRKVMKQIIKKAKNPVKNRVIPADILVRYREKIEAVQGELRNIISQEKEEKMLNKAEQDIERGKKKLEASGKAGFENKTRREWFQTQHQRKMEKEKAKEIFDAKVAGNKMQKKRKNTKLDEQIEEENRRQMKLQKIADAQQRAAKKQRKPKRLRAMVDSSYKFNIESESGPAKKKKFNSVFEDKLLDTSKRSVKSLRYLGPNRSGQKNKKR